MRAIAATTLAFVVLWLVLDRSAAWLGSFRGEAGLAVCALVLAAALAAEFALSRRAPQQAAAALGLRAPNRAGLVFAFALGAGLLAFVPLYAAISGVRITLRPDAALLAAGMFLQGGVAEELAFRGFLFRRLREGRSFWRAALLAAIPFTAVHALLFLTLDVAVALASIAVALSVSFPLAWLFERSGGSIWPPAIVHAAIQIGVKVIDAEPAAFAGLAMAWMALSASLPWLVFALLREPRCAAP